MRLFSLFLQANLFGLGYAASNIRRQAVAKPGKLAVEDNTPEGTVFNGVQVPPIRDLNGTTFEDDTANGYWLVESFSPYCHHCKSLAPKFQKFYEFYYTSDPLPASTESADADTSLNSFSRYYDLKFGKLDCVAFGTKCTEIGITQYPTIKLFHDGEEVAKTTGDQTIKELSTFLEDQLEIIRPGSRPAGGLEVPGVKDTSFSPKTPISKPKFKSSGPVEDRDRTAVLDSDVGEASSRKPRPKVDPNSKGTSIALTAENFQKKVTRTLDPWFIKFYAPWCSHCQRMAASWEAMAREMKGRLNVGEVNCEVDKRLCRDVHVESYPTIVYFQGPERIEYDGLRGLGDFISYANKAITASEGVREVNATAFEELEKSEEVVFTYIYDHATTSEDLAALERLPLYLIGHAVLVKSQDPELAKKFKIVTWPRLLVSRDGKVSIYDYLSPQAMRDVPKIKGWMRANWLPLVPELTASNARDIMDGKYVVLGILSRQRSDEFAVAKRELKNAAIEWLDREVDKFKLERQELRDAKQLRIEEAEDRNDQRALRNAKLIRINMEEIERKEVAFAWIDGIFWQRWIKNTFGISVEEGEKVIINDEDNRRYWDQTITTNPIVPSRTSILETLPKVIASPPKLQPKPVGSTPAYYFFRARTTVGSHPWITVGIILAIIGALVMLWRGSRRRGGGIALRGEKKESGSGLLGISPIQANGKVD